MFPLGLHHRDALRCRQQHGPLRVGLPRELRRRELHDGRAEAARRPEAEGKRLILVCL